VYLPKSVNEDPLSACPFLMSPALALILKIARQIVKINNFVFMIITV
jgi:hypothetical protein